MRPKRSLGQNFLRDESVLERIVAALDLKTSDLVLEIGPGRGALTERLVASGASVTAIELDRELVPVLRKLFEGAENFSVREGDVLESDIFSEFPEGGIKVVGNLPYYISTPILQRLIEFRDRVTTAVLMLQREVVDRITAPPGSSERGFLTVLIEEAFVTEKLFDVPPTSFFPQPKVWSSVVSLRPTQNPLTPGLRRLASIGFAQKRKTILNNFKNDLPSEISSLALGAAGVDPLRRAESLTIDEWRAIAETIGSQ